LTKFNGITDEIPLTECLSIPEVLTNQGVYCFVDRENLQLIFYDIATKSYQNINLDNSVTKKSNNFNIHFFNQ